MFYLIRELYHTSLYPVKKKIIFCWQNMCWLVYTGTTRVYHLPMWLTLNFPNLCACMYMYVRYGGGGPAAGWNKRWTAWNKAWTNDVTHCFAMVFYYMARDMLSLDPYWMPDEWRDIERCTKNRQDGAHKIGTPLSAKTPYPQNKNTTWTSPVTHIYIIKAASIYWHTPCQTFDKLFLIVPYSCHIFIPSYNHREHKATWQQQALRAGTQVTSRNSDRLSQRAREQRDKDKGLNKDLTTE